MLKFIRRNASGAWVKVMFLAIVAVFVFWGIGVGVGGGARTRYVAKVNDDVITELDLRRAYTNLQRMYQDIYKDRLPPEMLKALDLKGKTLDQLIRLRLLRQEANRIGLEVTDTEVRDSIATMQAFQPGGRFDKDTYLRVLRSNSLTPAEFEESKRDELTVGKLQDLISAGVHVSEDDVHSRYVYDNEKVDLNYVEFKADPYVASVAVSDNDVQAYFDAHQDKFREPDRVRLDYIQYSAPLFLAKAEISPEEVQAYYDSHKSEFSTPERVHARHILFQIAPDADDAARAEIRKQAEDVLAKARQGEDFAGLAEKYSQDSSAGNGGDLGFFPRGRMVPQFEAVAFSLSPGAISEIVETEYGLHIIKVEAREEAKSQTLEEARPRILGELKAAKSIEMARQQAHTDREKAAAGEPLAPLAEAIGTTVQTSIPVGKGETVPSVGNLISNAAITLDTNAVGPVVDGELGPVVFRVTEKIPAHVPPLTEIRAKVESALKLEKAGVMAKEAADAFLAKAQTSGWDSATSETKGVEEKQTGPFTRAGDFIPGIGTVEHLKKAAFDLTTEKQVAPAVYESDDAHIVVSLHERIAADEAQFAEQKKSLITQSENRRKAQVMEEFVDFLKGRATIDVNQEFLASISDSLPGGRMR